MKQKGDQCPAEKRRCSKCGKILAEMNPGPGCFSCTRPRVLSIRNNGVVFKRPATFKVIGLPSVCTSRETRGFNRVYIQYHGWGKGL